MHFLSIWPNLFQIPTGACFYFCNFANDNSSYVYCVIFFQDSQNPDIQYFS